MTALVKKLIQETWVDYFAGNQKEILKSVNPEILEEYTDAMYRLETDFNLQRELGIGI